MKKYGKFLLLALICNANFVFAQPLEPHHLSKPLLWLKADSATLGTTQWQDISGNGHHATPQSGMLPAEFARLNFNKAFAVEGEYFTVSGLPFTDRDMTGMVVYRLADTTERGIWEIGMRNGETENERTGNKPLRVGLTSQRLLGEKGDMHYRDSNDRITIVHTLFRNWDERDSVLLADGYTFELLRADSLPFYGRVAECLLFDWHIDDTTLVQYISYLALKYGITLYKTDYLSSAKRMIWDYHNNPDYSYSIAGLGRDDTLGLYQKQSYMLDEKIVIGLNELAITNEEHLGILENGEYLIWGFDSSLLAHNGIIYLDNGEEFEVYGNGLFQGTKARREESTNARNTFMTVDGSEWQGTIENYYLLIDRSGTGEFRPEEIVFYLPDYVDTNNILYFSNIEWDTDSNGIDRFCFTYVPVDSILSNRNLVMNGDGKMKGGKDGGAKGRKHESAKARKHEGASGQKDESGDAVGESNRYRVYPNPSEGSFVLEVDFAEKSDINVRLFSPEGKIIDTRTDSGRQNYRFPYQLSVSGDYLLEIGGGGETKTMKVVVAK